MIRAQWLCSFRFVYFLGKVFNLLCLSVSLSVCHGLLLCCTGYQVHCWQDNKRTRRNRRYWFIVAVNCAWQFEHVETALKSQTNVKGPPTPWTYSISDVTRKADRCVVRKLEGKSFLVRPRHKWERNIKIYLKETGRENMEWINLAQDKDK
jgi:hypothetical protein